MSQLQRIQAIIASKTSFIKGRSNDLNSSMQGPIALFEPLLSGAALAPVGLVGYNANGKTSTVESNIKDTMLTHDEYQTKLRSSQVERLEPICLEYEQDRHELDEPCNSDGEPLLSDSGYITPTPIDLDIREDKLSPVLDAGDSTRAITAWTWGLRLQVALIYVTRSRLKEAASYLSQTHRQLQAEDLTATAGLSQTYDIPLLRMGLQMIGKDIKNCQSDEGVNAVIETIRCLQPAELCIPRKCWELAGTVQRFYTDHSQPLSVQLEQLSEFLWRHTTCYRQEDTLSGNQHLAYLSGVLVTIPSRWLQGVLVLDHVGYIPGDAACAEAYSKLDRYACNILAVADSRAATVNRALQLLDKSRILQQLAAKVPNTPPVLVLMAAERTTELLAEGEKLQKAVAAFAKKGTAAELADCLQITKGWLKQLAAGTTLHEPEAKRLAAASGLSSLGPADVLTLRMYNLLQGRKRHQLQWLVRPAVDELKHKGWRGSEQWQGSEQSELDAAGVLTLVWWPRTYKECKNTLRDYQERLGPGLVEDACAVFANVTGVAVLQQFVRSSRLFYEEQQADAAIEAFDATREQVKELVPLVTEQMQQDMLTLLQDSVDSQSTAEAERQEVLSQLENLQKAGFELGPNGLKAFQDLACTAVRQELQPHLEKCTMERGLAEGIRMVLGDDIGDIADWKQQLGYDLNPPAGKLVGPAEYSTQLKRALFSQRCFKHWLQCDQVGNSITKMSENITKTPAECVLTPPQQVLSCVSQTPFITLPSQQQQGQFPQHIRSAQLKLGQIAAALRAALQPRGSARAVLEPQLQALRPQISSIIKSSFQSLSNFDRLMYPTVTQAMTENLYISITSTLVAAHKSTLPSKLTLLTNKFNELTAAMLQAVDAKVKEVVAMCWEKLLHELEVHIIRPIRFLQIDQQHQQLMLQQPGALTTAIGELVQLRCFMAAKQSSGLHHGHHSAPAAMLGAQASSSSTSVPQLLPTVILQLLSDDPDEFWTDTIDAILPQTRHLQKLAGTLCAFAEQQCGVLNPNPTIQQVLQCPELLQQCACALEPHVTLPCAIGATDLVQLWLGALPGAVRVQQLYDLVCGRPRSSAGATDATASAAPNDGSLIGSESYMKLLMELIKRDKLPWKLSDLRTVISPQLAKLTNDGVLLPGQLISSLLPSMQLQIALELYLNCYKFTAKSVGMVHTQRMVDALLPLSRVEIGSATDPPASGSDVQGSAAANATAGSSAGTSAAATVDSVSSILTRIPQDRIVISSSDQQLLRVSARPLPSLARPGVRATHVSLPVVDGLNNRIGTVMLNRDTEFLLCGTRTHCKAAVTKAALEKLDRQAPPVVILAAAMILQAEQLSQQELQQQQQPSSSQSRAAKSDHKSCLSRPCSQLWYDRLRAALQHIQIERSSNIDADSVPEVLQEQHWDVIETMQGKARFFYTGPLPAELLAGAGSNSSSNVAGSSVKVGFDKFPAVLAFAQTGHLHNGLKYLETQHHQRLLKQHAKVAEKTHGSQAAQQAGELCAGSSQAAATTPSRKRQAEASAAAAATAASAEAGAASTGSGSKRPRTNSAHITIGEVVSVTPQLQSDQPLTIYIRPSVSKESHTVKLSTEGAFILCEKAAPGDTGPAPIRQSDAAAGEWFGPIRTPAALVREATGLINRGWRDIFNADGTCWQQYKRAAERLKQQATTAHQADAAPADIDIKKEDVCN